MLSRLPIIVLLVLPGFPVDAATFDKAGIAHARYPQSATINGNKTELAWTLHNLALLDYSQKRTEQARQEYQEALKIYRELAQKDPETYLPDLAQTLSNLGLLDYSQKRTEQARQEVEESLKIYRELTQKNPQTYLPDLAQTLHNLGLLDYSQKRTEEARQEYEEALKIRRELAQKNPETYLPDLAWTLHNLGLLDYSQKRMEQARQEYQEALKIRRELAQKNPETYLPDLAQTLSNLGFLDYPQKRTEQTRQEYQEALKIYRELAQKDPETYLPDLAQTLSNLGLLDYSQKRTEQARQEYQEALKIYRELAQKDPQTYLPYVAMTLKHLGLPIQAGAVLLSMYQGSWPLLAAMAGVPLTLLAVVGLFGSRFRHSVASWMRESEGHPPVSVAGATTPEAMTVSCELILRRLDVSDVQPATGQEGIAFSEAEETTRDTRFAYTAAAIAYSVVTTFAMSTSLAAANPDWSTGLLVVFMYMMQWAPLLIWVWFLGISGRLRLAILACYLLLGLLLAPLDSRAVAMAVISLPMSVLFPMGLILLLARPLRPWLLILVAYLLFSIAGGALLHILPLPGKPVWSLVRPWQLGASAMFDVLAVALLGWILYRRRWRLPVAGLGLLAVASLLTMWLLPNSDVGAVLGALPSKTLQAFIVWLLFKLFALVQGREFLPAQMLHSHLCWGFLTIYLLIMTIGGADLYGGQGWLPWAIVLAFAVYLFMVHWLSRRIWAARVGRPGKRLLFLRVFGSADKREGLLDELDDTWRRVGRLDLIAGTDLAMRTLGSRMLEAFLLRRPQEHFLRTDADVDRRLEHLPSRLQGDARYPVNPVYCYATAWQRSVTRLAPESDAVLMDLRGFTGRNQGCAFELTWLVQQVLLSRIVLLTDQTTDNEVMEHVVTKAWADLPRTSPNAVDQKPVITVLNAIRRSNDNRRALFMLLLRAAYFPYEVSGCQ